MTEKQPCGYARSPYVDEQTLLDAPTVTLAGKEFHIPRLAVAQNRIVIACVKSLIPMLPKLEQLLQAAKEGNVQAVASVAMANFPIGEEEMESIDRAVHAGLTRGYVISRVDFENMPIGIEERLGALMVVIQQSFAFERKEAAPGGTAGEAPRPPSSTGTESSPKSAESSDGHGTTSNGP